MRKVETITHAKSGIAVDVYLDKITFTASALGKSFTAPAFGILRQSVMDHIEHWLTLDWHAIISVKLGEHDGWGSTKQCGITMELDRFYASRSPTGTVLTVAWDVDPIHRKAKCSVSRDGLLEVMFPLIAPYTFGKNHSWLNYSDSMWENLLDIRAGIIALYGKVKMLTQTREGAERLQAHVVKLLTMES